MQNPFVVKRKNQASEETSMNTKIELEEESDLFQQIAQHEKEKQAYLSKGISYQLNILIQSFLREAKCNFNLT